VLLNHFSTMLRKLPFLLSWLLISHISFSQIVIRNNCITQCANCTMTPSSDLATVFDWAVDMPVGTNYFWDFGEPGSPTNTSTQRTGSHQYCTPGVKKVTLTLTSGTTSTTKFQNFTVGQLPYIYLGKDDKDTTKTICDGQLVELNAFGKVGKPNYPIDVLWYPSGKTTDTIKVRDSGCYSVKITDRVSGCTAEAKMQIKICGERDPDKNISKFTKAWAFGDGASILFTGSPDNPTLVTSKINAPNGVAKMEDPTMSNGLIFYTDGQKVFDKSNNPIDPTKILNGDPTNSQGVTIIPKSTCKGCQAEYYVFTLHKNAKGENLIFYSIVDMKMNKGKGGISLLNEILSPVPSTSRILATDGGNGFYWLVTQDADPMATSTSTRIFKVSPSGISAPVVTKSGTSISAAAGSTGNTKISSPNSTKLAITIPGPPNNKVDIYDYDKSTGKSTLSFTLDLGISPPALYGVEFSPNDSVLYVSMQGNGGSIDSQILQFDISSKDAVKTLASKQVVYSGSEKVGALQIDPINHAIIFAAFQGSNILGKIKGLNNLVTAKGDPTIMANFTRNGFGVDASGKPITLPSGATSQLGLPPTIPFPQTPQNPPSITQTCEGTTFKFTVSQKLCDPLNNDRIDWKIYKTTLSPFPDPKTGILVPLDTKNPIFTYTGAELKYDFATSDTYVITATITNSCVRDYLMDAQQFDIVVLKPVTLDAEYNRICKTDAKIKLTTAPVSKNLQYNWSNGDKTPTATFISPGGDLSLVLTDTATKCSVRVSTKVNFLENKYVMPQKDFSICMDSPVPFLIQLNSSMKDLKFEWSGPSLSSVNTLNQILIKADGKYLVKITDKDNCVMNNTFLVSDKCEPVIIAPSIFTPNGDGKNDYFSPLPKVAKRVEILSLQIFNRWGEMIFFKSGSSDLQWDGKSNGLRVPQDSYAWVVQYKAVDFPEKGTQTIRGAVIVAY